MAESPLSPSRAERATEPVCILPDGPESLRSSGFSAVEELSGIIFQAANSVDSSWELSTAVQESLQILNLQQEDLAEFLSPTEIAQSSVEKGFAVLRRLCSGFG